MMHRKVQEWDDQIALGRQLIVTLNPGWRFGRNGDHARGFGGKSAALEGIRTAQTCVCIDCLLGNKGRHEKSAAKGQ